LDTAVFWDITSCSLIIKYRIREVKPQKTAISMVTAVGTGESVVVYSVGSNSLRKKPWFVHTELDYNLALSSYSLTDLSVPRANSSLQAFYKPDSVFALQRTDLSDFQRTDLNPILGVQRYEICYVEIYQGLLQGET